MIHDTEYGFCSEFTDTHEILSYRMNNTSHPIHWLPSSFRSYFFCSLHSNVLHSDIRADYIIIMNEEAKYLSNYRVRNRHLEKHGLAAVYPKENGEYRSYPSKLLFMEGDKESEQKDNRRIIKCFENEETMKEICDNGRAYEGGYENSFSTLYRWSGKGTIKAFHDGDWVDEIQGEWTQGVLKSGTGYEPEMPQEGNRQEYGWIQVSYGIDESNQEDIRGILGEENQDSLLFWGKMRDSRRVQEVLSPCFVVEEFGKILCDACRRSIILFINNCVMERRTDEEIDEVAASNGVLEEVIREYLSPTRMVEYVREMVRTGVSTGSEDAERLYLWLWDVARPAFRSMVVSVFEKSFQSALKDISKEYRDQIVDELVKDAIKQLVMKTAVELMGSFRSLSTKSLFKLLNKLLTPEIMFDKERRMNDILGIISKDSFYLDNITLSTNTVFDLLEEYHSTLDDLQALSTEKWNSIKESFKEILKRPFYISELIGSTQESFRQDTTILSSITRLTGLTKSIRNVLLCCSFSEPTSLRVYDLEQLERISFGSQSMGNCEEVSIFNLPSLNRIDFYDQCLKDCKSVIINRLVRWFSVTGRMSHALVR